MLGSESTRSKDRQDDSWTSWSLLTDDEAAVKNLKNSGVSTSNTSRNNRRQLMTHAIMFELVLGLGYHEQQSINS